MPIISKGVYPMNENKKKSIIDVDAKTAQTQKTLSILIIVAIALMIPVLIINCTLIFKQLADPGVPPSVFGLIPQYIQEDMDNLDIKKGDMILLVKAAPDDIEVGDVILFKTASGKYILQEVESIVVDSNGAVKGWYTIEPIEAFGPNLALANQLMGKYNGTRIWGLGAVAMFTQTVPGIIICMAIPLGLLVAYEVVNAKKKQKETEDDKAELLAELEALRKAKAESEANKSDNTSLDASAEVDANNDEDSADPLVIEQTPPEEITESSEKVDD